ncbi:hypothetical protein MMC13_006736 [Lambiella insularis]|nr:hypothetical protein [Lambiella insularis]
MGSLKESSSISFEDYLAITEVRFEWADSYDNKVDYSIVGHSKIEDMPAEEFVSMMSSPKFLGDPLVRTQHLMGASKYERVSDSEIIGHHQIRAAHQRYTGPDRLTVENRGHGHSFIMHWYRKVDGVWKLAGLCPKVYWNEHNFEKIFVQLSAEH